MTAYIISELDADNTMNVLGILFDKISALAAYHENVSYGYMVQLTRMDLDEYIAIECIDKVAEGKQEVLLTNINA